MSVPDSATLYHNMLNMLRQASHILETEAAQLSLETQDTPLHDLAGEEMRLAHRMEAAIRAVQAAGHVEEDIAQLSETLRALADLINADSTGLGTRRRDALKAAHAHLDDKDENPAQTHDSTLSKDTGPKDAELQEAGQHPDHKNRAQTRLRLVPNPV